MAVVLSCGKASGPLNVVLIGIDTLRPDHLGCYGYAGPTSPNIDRLAGAGVVFENVISQAPWTTPSFATVLTSLYPSQHGAGSLQVRLRSKTVTLAGLLRQAGYATGAIVNSGTLSANFGLNKGFDYYDCANLGNGRPASLVTEQALKWINLNKGGPFFVFVHYFDPHAPYSPPAPYDTLFDPDYRGVVGSDFKPIDLFADLGQASYLESLTDADWHHLRSLYDGEIAFTDAAVGRLLEGIRECGLGEKTIIVLLSDHGEEFHEHGSAGHGHSLFGELLRVPLIVAVPGERRGSARVSDQVRLLDVAPTILDLLGIAPSGPKVRFEGASLKPFITGSGEVRSPDYALLPANLAYSEAMMHGWEKKSLTSRGYKVIYETASAKEMLFDLRDDPGEKVNLRDARPPYLEELDRALLRTWFAVSDTWQIEIAGAAPGNDFTVDITAGDRTRTGEIFAYVFHKDGRILQRSGGSHERVSNARIRFTCPDTADTLALAIEIRPRGIPVTIDIKVDGKDARGITHVGDSLSPPERMPFICDVREATKADGRPRANFAPPYLVVWHAGQIRTDEPVEDADGGLKKSLRAIGYVQ